MFGCCPIFISLGSFHKPTGEGEIVAVIKSQKGQAIKYKTKLDERFQSEEGEEAGALDEEL